MQNSIKQLLVVITTIVIMVVESSASSLETKHSNNCGVCNCYLKNANEHANCSNRALTNIPANLPSNSTNVLYFDHNYLRVVRRAAFASVGLKYLQKISMQHCNISEIHGDAFEKLEGLFDLNLSYNNIKKLTGDMFRYSKKLKKLSCEHNEIESIDANLFKDFIYMQIIKLSHNKIRTISPEAFTNISVRLLNLNDNQLTYWDVNGVKSMTDLMSVDLTRNPWHCDCRLRDLRNYILEKRLCTTHLICDRPEQLAERLWSEIGPERFACQPTIISTQNENVYHVTDSSNFTLYCKVDSESEPNINWYFSKHRLVNENSIHQHFKQDYGFVNSYYWNNLTIIDLKLSDRGDYKCIASNFAGSDEKNFSLQIPENFGTSTLVFGASDNLEKWSIVFAIAIIIITIMIILILLTLCLLRKYCTSVYEKKSANDRLVPTSTLSVNNSQTVGGGGGGGGGDEAEKSLINSINHVPKSMRTITTTNHTNGTNNNSLLMVNGAAAATAVNGFEQNDVLNRLLENDSISSHTEDYKVPNSYKPSSGSIINYDETKSGTSKVFADGKTSGGTNQWTMTRTAGTGSTNHRQYPPDLLAFPCHNNNSSRVSPTGSSASTIPLTSSYQQQKPSPNHHQHLLNHHQHPHHNTINTNLYRTLPHQRSQSPFVGLPLPSPLPPPSSSPLVCVPKIASSGYVTIPRRPRASWSCSSPQQNLNPLISEPVYDNLGLRTTATGTSVLSLNKTETMDKTLTNLRPGQLSSSLSSATETNALKMVSMTTEAGRDPNSSIEMNGMSSLSSLSSPQPPQQPLLLKTVKIPPRPPPKPKKLLNSGPLFEDEGEDGTEV